LGTKDHINLQDPELEEEINKVGGDLEKFNEFSRSRFAIDSTENPHPRFKGLMASIRERRGEKVNIQIPIFPDKNTNLTEPSYHEPYPGKIYMDSMHFGMGCSCL
jgi:glutamate--cysteine ligase catalytic subunit